MQFSICTIAAFLALVCVGYDAYVVEKTVLVRGAGGKCVGRDGSIHPVGSKWYHPMLCMKHTCILSEQQYYEKTEECAEIKNKKENCEVVSRAGVYPACCPVLRCSG